MNATASVIVSVLAASAAAIGISLAMQPEPVPGDGPAVSALQQSVRDLEQRNRELAQRLDELANRPLPAVAADAVPQRTEAPSLSPDQVAAAVEAYLQNRGDGGLAAAAADASGAGRSFSLEEDLESLLGTSYFEDSELWKRAFEAGKMDEVIEALEQMAADNPNDVKSQMNLANAYMAYLQMDQSKWQMSMKADEQYDKVLAIDERHWEARFTKAMSYTFWPDFLGKKKAAISNFETLIEQQEQQPAQEHFAQTYLFLGNMLSERDPERAREIWQRGIQRHPQNAELLERLGQ